MTGRSRRWRWKALKIGLPSKPAVWRTYLLKKTDSSGEANEERMEGACVERSESDIVGAFRRRESSEVGTIDNLSWPISTMDALKAEIATKRKAIQDDGQGPSKYMRRGDLERLKAEQEQKTREEGEKLLASHVSASGFYPLPPFYLISFHWSKQVGSSRASTNSPLPDSIPEPTATNPESSYNLSNEETIRRLRVKGQPIRLFGESDRERRLRLRALELIEERDQERQGGQNDFKKALEDVENVEKLMNKNVDGSSSAGKRKDETKDSVDILDLDLLKTDPQKVYPIIYYALKRRLKEWEEWMDQRPGTSPARPTCPSRN